MSDANRDDELRRRLSGLSAAKRELLARRLAAQRRAQAESDAPRRLSDEEGPFELSFAQERFWFLEQLEPGNPAHHLPGRVSLRGPLDLAAYRRAWETIFRRHESLRTVFDVRDGRPLQRVRDDLELPLEVVDLRGLPPQERENECLLAADRAVCTPFDLARGPLLRLVLLRLGEEEHELVTCLHHVIADGISVQLLGAEIEAIYRALLAGETPRLPELAVQMRDFAAWQRARMAGEREARALAFWTQRLANLTELELPADFPRRAAPSGIAQREGVDLSEALVRDLRRFARSEGVTLYSVLLAAFQAALARWTGALDVAVGTLVAGRDRAELEPVIGLFVNTLVVRTDLSDDPGFRALAARVAKLSLEAQHHADFPFERVVDALKPERRLDRNPLVQVLFNFVDFHGYERELGGGLSMAYRVAQAGTDFDLTLVATVGEGALRLELEYDAGRFTPATVRRFVGHLETLLYAALRDPERAALALSILAPEERRALARWSQGSPNPAATESAGQTLHARIAAAAARNPERVAIEQGAARVTYAEVESRAEELAGWLRAQGIGPGDLVGIALPRTVELVPALLGVLKTGAAYVPLDPLFPAERLAFVRADAELALVLEALPARGERRDAVPPAVLDADALAYLIYTSGSSGTPKGVRVRHRSLVHALESLAREPGLGPADTLLAVTTLSFDIAGFELFGPLLAGGTVRLASAEEASDGARLAALLADERVTAMQATPATWRMLLLAGWRGRAGLKMLCGGEALSRDLADELLARGGELWNLYGPTETTIWSTVERVPPGPVTIGRPMHGTRLRVVDARGADVPIGIPGELWIGGAGVAEGYHRRPELTRERFVDARGERYYRTGDRVRWRPDGRLEFLGRADAQVKLRGFRIELGEIEIALRSHPAVADAAAAIREPRPGDQRLIAWIVPRSVSAGETETELVTPQSSPGIASPRSPAPPLGGWGLGMGGAGLGMGGAAAAPDELASALRAHLAAKLPPWMIPSAFAVLDALPLTPGGKVDRRALPEPPAPAPRPAPAPKGRAELGSPTERALAEIYREVLDTSDVGPDDSFFALGGHSLLATQLAARVQERLGVELSLRDVFAAPKVAALAGRIDALAADARAAPPRIELLADRRAVPLSFAQERLWFLAQLEGAGAAYHMPGAVRLKGALDADALERALAALIRRHEALRTSLRTSGGGRPVQCVEPDAELALRRVDLSALAPAQRDEALRAALAEAAREPFDLGRAPLVHATLVRLGPREHVLVLVQHHVVSDAWSTSILIRELPELYRAHLAGEPPALAALALQYADYAAWQRGFVAGERLERELAFWRRALAGAPPALALPAERPRPALQRHRGARLAFALGARRAAALRALARAEDATLFTLLLAAFQTLLFRLARQDDVVVGTTVAGRDRVDVEGVVGFFASTVPLRARFDDRPSFREHLARVRAFTLDALDHARVPFEKLVDELQPVRDLSRQPIFQVAFDLLNVPQAPLALSGLELAPVEVEIATAKFDLALQATDDEVLSCALELDTDLFERETAARWWSSFECLIDALLEDPSTPVDRLAIVAERERAALLALGVAEERERPRVPMHELVESVARAHPAAPAVRLAETVWTFAELERRANGVAAALVALGAGRGTLVGVALHRTPQLLAALLGVWKAGAAWLPLDPAHPPARLALLVSDAGASVVLASAETAALVEGCARIVRVEEIAPAGDPPRVHGDPEDLAYVLYTSGSTGRPKGVEVTHRGLVNYALFAAERYDVAAGAGAPAHSSIGFDLTLTSLFAPLLAGRTVTLVPDAGAGATPGGAVLALAASARTERGQSLVKLTPSHLDALARELAPAEAAGWTRAFVAGGEALHASTLRFWREHAPATRIFNEYGPTEAVVGCVVHEVPADGPLEGAIAIGRPIPNTRVYVLDAHLEPVPRGVVGELWIGGACVARGYRGRADLTAERFRVDPFSPGSPGSPGGRMYKSGDLVRWRADGELEYLGRADDELKVRGHRVDPAEVEEALRRASGLREVAVALRGGRLVAYLVAPAGAATERMLDGLGARVASELPAALVPSAFVRVDGLSLSPNGKLDRAALPEPRREVAQPSAREALAAPASDAEAKLAAIFAGVLGVERVGRTDGFFALGGDSILSIQVVARAAEAGLFLRIRDVFERQTVAALAAVAATSKLAREEAPLEGEVPLLPAQRWLLERDLPELAHWNQALAFEIRAEIGPEDLERAFAALHRHHDALRMRFERRDGKWVQVCAGAAATLLTRVDLGGTAASELEQAFTRACAAAQRELAPEKGEVSRAVWFDLGGGRPPRLLWVLHHLVVDGVSWRVLLDDLSRLLRAAARGVEPPLLARTSSVRVFASALPPALEARALPEGEARLPRDRAGDAAANTEGSCFTVEVELDLETTRALIGSAPRPYRASAEDILVAALGEALGAWSQREVLAIDVEGHGRVDLGAQIDVTRTVGWFTRILTLSVPGAGALEPGKRLLAVKEARRALAERAGAEPRADVLFNFLGRVDAAPSDGAPLVPLAADVGPEKGPSNPRAHAFEIDARVAGGRLRAVWRASAALHTEATVRALATEWTRAVRASVEHCLSRNAGGFSPSDFPLAGLDPPDLDRVTSGTTGVEDVLPLTPTQQGMFFHGLYAPASAAYDEELTSILEGAADAAALRRAYETLVARHPLFRARIVWKGLPEPLFVIAERIELPWIEVDWSGLPEEEQRERLAQLSAPNGQGGGVGFDLERGPLFRIVLAHLGPRRIALSFRYHHVILDGWSMPIVLEELLAAYDAFRGGESPRLKPSAPWREYVAWLRARDLDEARAFWRGRLAGFERATPLGTSEARASGSHGELEMKLERGLSRRLRDGARDAGVTLSTLVQAAWALLLARRSGESDVVLGATVAGRPAELADVAARVGLFINTLPVRVPVDEDAAVDEWLRRLQRERAEELAFEWTPLALAQSCAGTAPGAPLFDSIVVFENYPLGEALKRSPGGLTVVETRVFERTSYALTLVAVPGERLLVRLLYDDGRFSSEDALHLLAGLGAILDAIAAAPRGAVRDVPVLAPRERQRLFYEWGSSAPAYASAPLVHEAFRAAARRAPHALAVLAGESAWTYRELDEHSDRIAAALAARGAGPEVLVALLVERSPEMIAALLGILKAGAAYLPLEPDHPDARLRAQVREAGATLAVASAAQAPRLAPTGLPVLLAESAEQQAAPPPRETARGEHLAYVIATSGSTGAPKCVAVEHRSLAHFACAARDAYGITAADRVLQFASPAFDTSAEEIYPAPAAGATLVLRDDELVASPAALARAVRELGITVLDFPTAYWHELVAGLDDDSAAALRSVRLVILGGEAVEPARLTRWRELVGGRGRGPQLLNTYGPTEATVVCALADVTGESGEPAPERVPIGRPIAGATIYLLDAELRPVPSGAGGELCVGGPGVARGYVGRPDLTRARFVPDCFALDDARGDENAAEPRLYRTGDRARFRADGTLEFLGRADGQVKVRGHRVELGEVEHALRGHAAVAEAVVLRRERAEGGDYLAAAVVPRAGAAAEASELIAFLRERLPEPMVPAQMALFAALPRTPTGKLDRAALLCGLGEVGMEPRAAPSAAPRTRDEARVARIFARVLGAGEVGVHEDFFALGGDSLVAIRLMAAVLEEFGVELPLRELFEGPTPAEVAAAVAALARGDGEHAPAAPVAGTSGPSGRRALDVAAEAVLPADVRPEARAQRTSAARAPRRVLVTGANGFLGSHVLAELAQRTDAELVALVRASSPDDARERLRAALERRALWSERLGARLAVVAGDLARERFGLAPAEFDALGASLDAVFHAGASVSFLQPYASLRPANVGGTLEALRLACRGEETAFHHVSTVGVFDVASPPALLTEDLPLEPFAGVRGGYAQSKWVAEALVRAAGERGLATRIFRPGRLVASAATGAANDGDVALELLLVCLDLGASPDVDLAADATPVDYAARALVHLALLPETAGGTFHLVNATVLRAREVARALGELGRPLEPLPPARWWAELRRRVEADPSHRFFPLLPLLAGAPELRGAPQPKPPVLDDSRARAFLDPAKIRPAALDRAYFERLLARLEPAERQEP